MARAYDVRRLPGFGAIALLTFVLLYLPILVLVVFSFNAGSSQSEWDGFSLQWYAAAFANQQVQDVSIRSLWLAAVAAGVATALAVPAALATTRVSRFPGQTMIYALINQPLMVPEIVTGIALLICVAWVKVNTGYTGMGYLVAAHTAFCIPFARHAEELGFDSIFLVDHIVFPAAKQARYPYTTSGEYPWDNDADL